MRAATVGEALAFAVLGLAAAASMSCSSNPACGTAELDTDIRVSVTDSANGFGVCGATVAASDGNESYACSGIDAAGAPGDADLEPNGCWYACSGSGAPGTTLYTVSVTAPGFADAMVTGVPIDMTRDSCGLTTVEGRQVAVALVSAN